MKILHPQGGNRVKQQEPTLLGRGDRGAVVPCEGVWVRRAARRQKGSGSIPCARWASAVKIAPTACHPLGSQSRHPCPWYLPGGREQKIQPRDKFSPGLEWNHHSQPHRNPDGEGLEETSISRSLRQSSEGDSPHLPFQVCVSPNPAFTTSHQWAPGQGATSGQVFPGLLTEDRDHQGLWVEGRAKRGRAGLH